ncbi:MAG: leucine-rich repeat domain-containing protein [Oscillospiraceae bacterium]|nr:leucine-rich repeat domain-containing protein [Oscillospiraceae bacterium]
MKKLLSITLAMVMLLSVFTVIPTVGAEEVSSETTDTVQTDETVTSPEANTEKPSRFKQYGDYTYEIVGDYAIIRQYNGKDKKVVIPSEIDGYWVKEIWKFAFSGNKIIEEVTISHTVTDIRQDAFSNCTNLKKVNFGKSVKVIGSWGFYNCKSLTKLNIPPNVKSLRSNVISGTSIKTLNIGRKVNYVHPYAMETNTLEKIVVNKHNRNYSHKDGVLYNKRKTSLVTCPRAIKKTELKIPETVKKINTNAFLMNKNLKKIILPKALTKIEDNAFASCKKLKEITIPKKVQTIRWCAFANCRKLSKIKFESDNKVYIEFGIFQNCVNLKSVTMPNFYIEELNVGGNFEGCKLLNSVYIPSYIQEIPAHDFMDCPNLKSVTIPSTVKKIGKQAFGYVYYGKNYKTKKVSGFTIKGKKGSAAYKYAKKNGFKFVAI